jgi:glycosyltransferase involved in cell wall biosynthesis
MDISIVIPLKNEFENVEPLYEELREVMQSTHRSFELIFVDDGSTDDTVNVMQRIAARDPQVRLILLRKNFGQTAALQAGFDYATGQIIVTLDGDGQNDPNDIPLMLDRLTEQVDVVLGYRKVRQDAWLHRRLPSKIANHLISFVLGYRLSDLGCALKVMRSSIVSDLELYGEMHRYIAVLAIARGARCVEVETHHRARIAGRTKYGLGRTTRVLLDLLTVKYITTWFDCPMRLFGRIGFLCAGLSLIAGMTVLSMKYFGHDMTGNPLLMLTVLASIASVQFFSLGLIGEVCARIYYHGSHRRHYCIKSLVNFSEEAILPIKFDRERRAA